MNKMAAFLSGNGQFCLCVCVCKDLCSPKYTGNKHGCKRNFTGFKTDSSFSYEKLKHPSKVSSWKHIMPPTHSLTGIQTIWLHRRNTRVHLTFACSRLWPLRNTETDSELGAASLGVISLRRKATMVSNSWGDSTLEETKDDGMCRVFSLRLRNQRRIPNVVDSINQRQDFCQNKAICTDCFHQVLLLSARHCRTLMWSGEIYAVRERNLVITF